MKNTLLNIWNFYLEGFRSMTLGRTLWLIILVTLFIMFFILKIRGRRTYSAGYSAGRLITFSFSSPLLLRANNN